MIDPLRCLLGKAGIHIAHWNLFRIRAHDAVVNQMITPSLHHHFRTLHSTGHLGLLRLLVVGPQEALPCRLRIQSEISPQKGQKKNQKCWIPLAL